jgi:hypothetical protein
LTASGKFDTGGTVSSSGQASFAILLNNAVVSAFVRSDGAFENQGVGAMSNARAQVFLTENLIASIPNTLDGFDVYVSIAVPVHAFGNGSSWGFVQVTSGTGLSGNQTETLRFGNFGFYDQFTYLVQDDVRLDFLIRGANDSSHIVVLPFALQVFFDSASLVQGGSGFIDASNTIGLRVTSAPGVTFSSESGLLDALLQPASPVFEFTGFLPPVENPPTLNSLKAGAAVPVKFGLGGDQSLDIFSATPGSERIACSNYVPLEEIEDVATAGGSSLTYDRATGQYTYVWKTERKWAGTCRRFTMKLVDGTEHTATFKFK